VATYFKGVRLPSKSDSNEDGSIKSSFYERTEAELKEDRIAKERYIEEVGGIENYHKELQKYRVYEEEIE